MGQLIESYIPPEESRDPHRSEGRCLRRPEATQLGPRNRAQESQMLYSNSIVGYSRELQAAPLRRQEAADDY
jgi:hypothetical protein